jgi:cell shape-determining protein MreD
MYGKPSSPRNLLWPIIIGVVFGIGILTAGSDWMLSLLGFVPAMLFAAMFAWAVVSERRI